MAKIVKRNATQDNNTEALNLKVAVARRVIEQNREALRRLAE